MKKAKIAQEIKMYVIARKDKNKRHRESFFGTKKQVDHVLDLIGKGRRLYTRIAIHGIEPKLPK